MGNPSSRHGSGGRSRNGFLRRKKRKALLTGEVDWLRAGQAVSALSAGAGILCAIFLGYASLEEREAEAKLAELSAVRIEMEAERKERAKRKSAPVRIEIAGRK